MSKFVLTVNIHRNFPVLQPPKSQLSRTVTKIIGLCFLFGSYPPLEISVRSATKFGGCFRKEN